MDGGVGETWEGAFFDQHGDRREFVLGQEEIRRLFGHGFGQFERFRFQRLFDKGTGFRVIDRGRHVVSPAGVGQGEAEDRSIEATLNLAWELMSSFPRDMLTRLSETDLAKYHQGSE